MSWSPMMRAATMRKEILRLSTFRRAHGEILDAAIWGAVIAAVLAREPAAKYPLGKFKRAWPGLDALTLADAMRLLGFKAYDADKLFNSAGRRKRKITPLEIGRRICLTAAERTELNIRCIDAFDQTRDKRIAAAKQRKTERDQRRSKTHHGESLMKMKPWEAEGICRRTWYKRHKIPDASAKLCTVNEAIVEPAKHKVHSFASDKSLYRECGANLCTDSGAISAKEEGLAAKSRLGSERKTSNGDAVDGLASIAARVRRTRTSASGNGAGNGNGHDQPPPPKTWHKPVIEELSPEEAAAAHERLKDVPAWHEERGED